MKLQLGDSVFHEKARAVGIVEARSGGQLAVRWGDSSEREWISRSEVIPLAAAIAKAKRGGHKFCNELSISGDSDVATLVGYFGYSTGQLRRSSVEKVVNQLRRAGLDVESDDDQGFGREARFWLRIREMPAAEGPEPGGEEEGEGLKQQDAGDVKEVPFPCVHWTQAFGLAEHRLLPFLRALSAREPILCVLRLPDKSAEGNWLQPTWEALLAWAFRSAQRFLRAGEFDTLPSVQVGTGALLSLYLQPSALTPEGLGLREGTRSLNLVTVRGTAELPLEMTRLKSRWPGPIFEFDPSSDELESEAVRELAKLLYLIGGRIPEAGQVDPSPLALVLWAKDSWERIQALASAQVGALLAAGKAERLRGSNEGALALALKVHVAAWAQGRGLKDVQFEAVNEKDGRTGEDGRRLTRTDLLVPGEGRFEIETMQASGPFEAFAHQKIFARLKGTEPFYLVVPNAALLWAGPLLADVAHHLDEKGKVLFCLAEGGIGAIPPSRLAAINIESETPLEAQSAHGSTTARKEAAPLLKLEDVVGYLEVAKRIQRHIVWPEKRGRLLKGLSRSPGILFFGPPGCGKSRWARAIAGELEHDVRLLAPSDLRGEYLGWGQVRIREQFDWVVERERRMLVIDELDAVARSRRDEGGMHTDDKASVNELLVQLDRASLYRRLIIATTNYVDSMDDAVLRSGRFGTFVPVPPPDVNGASGILAYYVGKLAANLEPPDRESVRFARPDEFMEHLLPLFADCEREGVAYCGADLEAAVANAWVSVLHQALGDRPTLALTEVKVALRAEDIARELAAGPRSIHKDALERFREERARYCGRT